MKNNQLWFVTDSGIRSTIPDSHEQWSYLLNDADEPHFETEREAILYAIKSLSVRIKELESA